MRDTNLEKKHIFLSSANPHVINLILNFTQKSIISKNDVILLLDTVTPQSRNIEKLCELHSIDFMYYEKDIDVYIQPITLNSLSLQPHTARIIIDFIDQKIVDTNQVNILITDDETDRWLALYKAEGEIKVNTSALIDENVLKVLSVVDNYIAPYTTWGKPLENILGRNLNIIDAVLPFNVLDYQSQECLEAFLHSRKREKPPSTYKILLFTKHQNPKKVFNIIASYLSGKIEIPSNLMITLGIWLPLNPKGMMLYMSLKALIRIKKLSIKLRLEQPVSSEQYAVMLYGYDCLILQERGGFSTAKYFAENVGKLITLKGSPNDKALIVNYSINTFNSISYVEAIKDAISAAQKNEVENISTFASQLTKQHKESFDTLRSYWNSF